MKNFVISALTIICLVLCSVICKAKHEWKPLNIVLVTSKGTFIEVPIVGGFKGTVWLNEPTQGLGFMIAPEGFDYTGHDVVDPHREYFPGILYEYNIEFGYWEVG